MELTEPFQSNCFAVAKRLVDDLPDPVIVLVTSHTVWFPFHIAVVADDRVYHFRRHGNPWRFWRFRGQIETLSISDALVQMENEGRRVVRHIERPNQWSFVWILVLAVGCMPVHVLKRCLPASSAR